MAKITIHNETFTATSEPEALSWTTEYRRERGTVSVSLGCKMVTAEATRYTNGNAVYVDGFVGRYRTSPKPWRATVSGVGSDLRVFFGRDDRSGRFNKQNAISYEPETFSAI